MNKLNKKNKLIKLNRNVENKNKFNLIKRKDNTINSLKEVEYFLCNFKKTLKYIIF